MGISFDGCRDCVGRRVIVSVSLRLRQIGVELIQRAAPALRMLSWPASKVLRSSSVALCGAQRIVNLVLPPGCSSNVKVESISSGQVGAIGCRVVPPASSENELMNTIRSGATISRYTNLPHIGVPSGAFMP